MEILKNSDEKKFKGRKLKDCTEIFWGNWWKILKEELCI